MVRYIPICIISAFLACGCHSVNSALPTAQAETTKETVAYIVQPGDTATKVAGQFHISVARLSVLNPGVDLSRLSQGQRLFVSE